MLVWYVVFYRFEITRQHEIHITFTACHDQLYNDFLRNPEAPQFANVKQFLDVDKESSYEHKELETAFVQLSKPGYARQVGPTTLIPIQLGNVYTAALFVGLLSLISNKGAELAAMKRADGSTSGARVLMFAYGSGLASSVYSFTVDTSAESVAQLTAIQQSSQINERLSARVAVEPSKFNETMELRESLHHSDAGFQPKAEIDSLFPGTFYLLAKDDSGRRTYGSTPSDA
jgi:hydroxymethylglutaryl-CoA synthase